MPPTNTPATQRTPTSPQTPRRPLTPLSYLSSPVPDLASTLHTSTSVEQTEEANVNFLRDSLTSLDQPNQQPSRSHIDSQRDPRLYHRDSRATPAQAQASEPSRLDTSEDLSRRERLQRVLARLNRLHEPSASSTSAYSNRTPSPSRQSLYDWAPSNDDPQQDDRELDAILNELRRQQPDTHPDILRILSRSQIDRLRDQNSSSTASAEPNDMTDALERLDRFERRTRERRERERRARESEWLSLRSRAMLQRARQDGGGGSPGTTERMLRYVMERERSGMSEEEERARGAGWFRPSPTRGDNEEQQNASPSASRSNWDLPSLEQLRERDRQERVEQFRRGYLADSVPPRAARISTPPVPAASTPPSDPHWALLANALKYLSELRRCISYEDSLSTAIDHGLATKELFAVKHDDFIMDLDELPPLPYSSWLQSGTVFEGHQHANALVTTLEQQRQQATSHVEQINPNYRGSSTANTTGFDHPPGSTRVAPFAADSRPSHLKDSPDHWPVRVMIHSVDPENMTLQGTMEAYDVPQHQAGGLHGLANSAGDRPKAGKKHAPITTFLEGHIVDVRTHTFLTPSPHDDKLNPHGTRNSTNHSNDTINFPSATPQTDAQNWLKLPPFSNLLSSSSALTSNKPGSRQANAEALASISRTLLSTSQLQRLHNEYIFMRWKEKCFIHSTHNDPCTAPERERQGDQDRGHGLTISGFYYVSLRRSDGVVEGIYFDPASTPFQHLRLKGGAGGWGAWGFR